MVANMVAAQVEKAVDSKLDELERDMHDLEGARQRRMKEMKELEKKKKKWRAQGHGSYDEVHEHDFFGVAKQSEVMAVHFYRDTTPRCQIVDKHLQLLAPQHLECRFIKVNAEKSPFLAERMDIIVLPTIALIRDNQCIHKIIGFGEMGDTDDFATSTMAKVLSTHGVVIYQENDEYAAQQQAPSAEEVRKDYVGYQKKQMDDYDSDDWENWE